MRSLFLALALAASATALAQPVEVSLVQLIASPQAFDGKHVRVIGFVRLEFEGDAIYLHKDDFTHGITKNGLWLDVDLKPKQSARVNNRYALVEGVFSLDGNGHLGLWSGSIKKVTRIDPWR